MTDHSDEDLSPPATPGRVLREARELKQLSQQQVADKLNLTLNIIEHIDDNDFAELGVSTYIRGYLRAYAKVVESDAEQVIQLFNGMGLDKKQSEKMTSFSRRTERQQQENRVMLVTYLIISIVVAGAVWFWWQQSDLTLPDLSSVTSDNASTSIPVTIQDSTDQETISVNEAAIAPVTAEKKTVVAENSSVPQQEAQEQAVIPQDLEVATEANLLADPQIESLDTEGQTDTQVANENTDESQVSEPETEVAASETRVTEVAPQFEYDASLSSLVMTFNGDCWVRVEDARGEAIAFGVKKAGKIMPLSGKAPFSIKLGAPENVSIVFQDQPIDMSRFRSGRVANFIIPFEND